MKFLKYIMIAGLLMVGATSCNDWMDILPENTLPESDVDYTKTSEMYMPVSGVYAKLRTGGMHWVISAVPPAKAPRFTSAVTARSPAAAPCMLLTVCSMTTSTS